jgi:hypothetical protein
MRVLPRSLVWAGILKYRVHRLIPGTVADPSSASVPRSDDNK